MRGHVTRIGKIYREIIEEANRPTKIIVIGKNGVGKSEIAAWLVMGNPTLTAGELDMIDIREIDSKHESVAAAVACASAADLILLVIDASKKPTKAELAVWQGLKRTKKPALLVANKIDLPASPGDVESVLRVQYDAASRHFAAVSAVEGLHINDGLIPKIAHLAKDIEAPLGRRFPILRKAVADRIIQRTAAENTVIGAMVFLPGADTPIMTANQVRMIMKLAVVYGQDLGLDRLKELIVVLGGALAFRTLARQAVAFIPVLGWAIKGGVAYAGTLALGKAAVKYFERTDELAGEQIEVAPESIRLLEIASGKERA